MTVNAFASGLDHPRTVYVLPNGDVLVAETNAPPKPDDGKGIKGMVMKAVMKKAGAGVPSANRITLLRDADGDGVAETRSVFLQRAELAVRHGAGRRQLYVANTDAMVRFPYSGRHGSRARCKGGRSPGRPAQSSLDQEPRRQRRRHAACTRPSDPTATSARTASRTRKIAPRCWKSIVPTRAPARVRQRDCATRSGWPGIRRTERSGSVVNERDELGNDLVPDYLTSVRDGAFYGWPYSYYGQHVDTRVKPARPDLVAKAIAPDYALGPHMAPLGLVFYTGQRELSETFPERRLRRSARLVEPQAAAAGTRWSSCRSRKAGLQARRRRADRFRQRGWRGAGPSGRRGHRHEGAIAGGRRRGQHDLAGDAGGEIGGAVEQRSRAPDQRSTQ